MKESGLTSRDERLHTFNHDLGIALHSGFQLERESTPETWRTHRDVVPIPADQKNIGKEDSSIRSEDAKDLE